MQEKQGEKKTKMSLADKLNKIQTELKAPKNLFNKFGNYNYRNAEGILEGVKPLLKETKTILLLEDEIIPVATDSQSRFYVKATAKLKDCESDEEIKVSAFARESADKKGQDESQITGSTSSYARKYALNGLFILDDTKDEDSEELKTEKENKASKETESKITQKQKDEIGKLVTQLGMNIKELKDQLARVKCEAVEDLSEKNAKLFIEFLNKKVKEKENATTVSNQ